jgi:hypothetical protein
LVRHRYWPSLLVNAFHQNDGVAVIIARDGDYVPVIEELKRMGRTVYVKRAQARLSYPNLFARPD